MLKKFQLGKIFSMLLATDTYANIISKKDKDCCHS